MTDKLDDVWFTRDFPVLREVTRRIDAGEPHLRPSEIAASTGLRSDDVSLAGQALKRRGLVEVLGAWQEPVIHFTGVSGEAYLLTGLHPSADDAVTSLVEALRQAAEQVTDPDEESRLRRLADGVLGVGTDVMGAVLGAVVTHAMGQ